ncbi:bifunctional metallophosphatase/5'-nucleotidase, partial [Enterococcus faecalis]|nr:bifunctional metallophosphatase/5'-nucleotidase [Enterococcus faecalis]
DLVERVPGIDALVTGHQHREIATKLNGIPVIQPGFRGAFGGEITLEVEPMAKGYRVIGSDGAIHPVGKEQPDTEVLALTTALHDEVEEWLDQPVGNVEEDMTIQNQHAVRLNEHPYIE